MGIGRLGAGELRMIQTTTLKIIIADDHELLREALKPHLLGLAEDVAVIEASTYDEVLALARTEAAPALIILDLGMPGPVGNDRMTGLRAICDAYPNIPVVIISGTYDGPTVIAAIQNGARGFIPKTTRGRTLISALRLVLDGEVYVPPSLVAEVEFGSVSASASTSKPNHPVLAQLSGRESTSLKLLVQGMTNKEIARQLDLQEITVKMHLRNAYRKIGASNRIDAVRIAMEQGFSQSL